MAVRPEDSQGDPPGHGASRRDGRQPPAPHEREGERPRRDGTRTECRGQDPGTRFAHAQQLEREQHEQHVRRADHEHAGRQDPDDEPGVRVRGHGPESHEEPAVRGCARRHGVVAGGVEVAQTDVPGSQPDGRRAGQHEGGPAEEEDRRWRRHGEDPGRGQRPEQHPGPLGHPGRAVGRRQLIGRPCQ